MGRKQRGCVGRGGSLSSRTETRRLIDSRGTSDKSRVRIELLERFFDAARYREAYFTGNFVEGNGETDEFFGIPFDGQSVIFLQCRGVIR